MPKNGRPRHVLTMMIDTMAMVGLPSQDGPVLVRVAADYGKRLVRWISAAKDRFTKELTTEQKVRFLARIGSRSLQPHPWND